MDAAPGQYILHRYYSPAVQNLLYESWTLFSTLCVSTANFVLKRWFGVVWQPQTMKIMISLKSWKSTIMMTNFVGPQLREKWSYRHAAHRISNHMIISIGVLHESAFPQRNQELRSIKDRPPTENYGCGAGPIHPSPVLGAGGKPSTWLPPGKTRRASQHHNTVKSARQVTHTSHHREKESVPL